MVWCEWPLLCSVISHLSLVSPVFALLCNALPFMHCSSRPSTAEQKKKGGHTRLLAMGNCVEEEEKRKKWKGKRALFFVHGSTLVLGSIPSHSFISRGSVFVPSCYLLLLSLFCLRSGNAVIYVSGIIIMQSFFVREYRGIKKKGDPWVLSLRQGSFANSSRLTSVHFVAVA